MKQICYELLDGTLEWSGKTGADLEFTNSLPIPVRLSGLPNKTYPNPYISGHNHGKIVIEPGNSFTFTEDEHPGYYAVNTVATGGLINVFEFGSGQPGPQFNLDHSQLNVPNDIGPVPIPTSEVVSPPPPKEPPRTLTNSTIVIPPDSPRVVVGCGTAVGDNGSTNFVIREQFWDRQGDSVCLAGHESRTVSYTTMQGKQETSSHTDTIAKNVNASVNAGWGPVSASLSASLSTNSTSFQQVTVTEQTTTYVSHTIVNPHEEPVAYYRWQLMDVITVFDSDGKSLSSVIMAESPNIVMGPYWVSTQPHPPGGSLPERGSGLLEYS